MIDEPTWLDREEVIQLHNQSVERHGGLLGIRDEGALDSTLARPKNLIAYQTPDIFELAASYAFGLARNHCFVDGNKRIALAASEAFLLDNGFLVRTDADRDTRMFEELAAGNVTEKALAGWFREISVECQI